MNLFNLMAEISVDNKNYNSKIDERRALRVKWEEP